DRRLAGVAVRLRRRLGDAVGDCAFAYGRHGIDGDRDRGGWVRFCVTLWATRPWDRKGSGTKESFRPDLAVIADGVTGRPHHGCHSDANHRFTSTCFLARSG